MSVKLLASRRARPPAQWQTRSARNNFKHAVNQADQICPPDLLSWLKRQDCVMIHKFSLNHYNIVLDVCSGAVHVLDDLSFRLVDFTSAQMPARCPEEAYAALSDYSRDEVSEAYGELYTLVQDGLLHTEDDMISLSGRSHRPRSKRCVCILPMTATCGVIIALQPKEILAMAES